MLSHSVLPSNAAYMLRQGLPITHSRQAVTNRDRIAQGTFLADPHHWGSIFSTGRREKDSGPLPTWSAIAGRPRSRVRVAIGRTDRVAPIPLPKERRRAHCRRREFFDRPRVLQALNLFANNLDR